MARYGIIYLHNGKQGFFSTHLAFGSQRQAVMFFWGYNPELRGLTQQTRVIATVKSTHR